jgi:integrase/recombinase XerC
MLIETASNTAFYAASTVQVFPHLKKSMLKRGKKKLPEYLTEQEMDVVRDWIDNTWAHKQDLRVRNRAIFELLYDTGLRIGELCSLKVLNVDDDKRTIQVCFDIEQYQLMRITGNHRVPLQKTGERLVVVSDRTVRLLTEYINLYRPRESVKFGHGYLFCTHYPAKKRGQPMTANALEHIFERMNRPVSEGGCAVSKHIHAHLWRHAAATNLRIKGADTRSIQEQLGHQNPETTAIYDHLTPEHRRSELDKVWKRDDDASKWGIDID